MVKSKFKTKLTKKQKRNNILVALTVIICSYIFILLFCYSIGIFDDYTMIEACVFGVAASFYILTITMFPILLVAIALGAQKGKAKRVNEDSSYVPVQGITYYRDQLRELNPALVSLLIDLDIYGQKVLVATLLRMQNKKAICFDKRNRIIVTAKNMQELDESEKELLYLIQLQKGKLNNKKKLRQWKENRFHEAENDGYIQKKDKGNYEKIAVRYILVFIFFTLVSIVLWRIFLSLFDKIGVVFVCVYLLIINALLFIPTYCLLQKLIYMKRGDVIWERTLLGNETAEKIAGLGRFINEFSCLSETKKEEVVLWDDYLVYAIVLEENEKIVKDIHSHLK